VASTSISLRRPTPAPGEADLRLEVRRFLAEQDFEPRCDAWLTGFDPEFSRALAAAGLVGLTIPPEYGGHGRTALERYVVTEELLAAGAPVAAHWIADRQTAPLLLRYGTEDQRRRFLPPIARGESYFAIGMSEPDSGSDLASIRTRGERIEGGWRVNGRKVWTSHAHRSHFMISLCRTAPATEDRHAGLSQLLIDLSAPGVDVRPVRLLNGEHHFNEVILEDVVVPDEQLVGVEGHGWPQVISELAYERSGPERLLSTFTLLSELTGAIGTDPGPAQAADVGRLVGELMALRQMSRSVATALHAGDEPVLEAALVKDLGTGFEQRVGEVARLVVASEPHIGAESRLEALLAQAILEAPGFTLRGGTTEILRGIVARGLGLR
jgi:alkylation response protein AidB-like acyl-CoA dehydrogenase